MHLSTFLPLLAIPTLSLSSPTPSYPLQPRQAPTNLTLVISHFRAFMHNQYLEGPKSNLTFTLTDPHPDHSDSVQCVIPDTYFSLWGITALYEPCGERERGFNFLFGNGNVAVQRRWVDTATGKTYTATSSQNPYWKEGVNVTVTETGKWFIREEEWVFPVARVQGA